MANSKFENLSKELISHLLGLEKNEENFQRSQEYVMSNLLYHHCLNVNSHEVQRRIDGVILKLQVHGHHRTSEKLAALTEKLKSSTELDSEVDLKWSILSFLLEVSQNPTSNVGQLPLTESCKDFEEDCEDEGEMCASMWQSLLLDDIPKYPVVPDEPLSDWSSLSSSEDEEDDTEDLSSGCVSPTVISVSPKKNRLNEAYLSQTQLDFMLQPSYWAKVVVDINPTHPGAALPVQMTSSDIAVKEWHVVREVLWLLLRPSPGYIFTRGDDGYIKLSTDTSISSLSQVCLTSLLKRVENMAAKLEEIDAWTAQAECSSENILPPTLRSYASGLHLWRTGLITKIVEIESEVRNKESTSLIWLMNKLQPLMNNVDLVAKIHSEAFNCKGQPSQSQPLKLLSVLVCSIEGSTNVTHRSILLRLFLHSIRYYLHLISLWLQQSSTPPNCSHFILYRNKEISTKDPQFWSKAYTEQIPGRKTTLKEDLNLPGLDFLRCIRGPLAEIGRIRELLEMNFKGNEYKHATKEIDVEEILITEVAKLVGTPIPDNDDTDQLTDLYKTRPETAYQETASFDPYLMEAFKETPPNKSQNLDKLTKIIENMSAKNSIKIEKVLGNLLLPIVRSQQASLGDVLTRVLLEQYDLSNHMLAVRSVYLLEASDIMDDFFSHLFTKIRNSEHIEEVDLTLYLQYCVARKFPELSQNFSVCLSKLPCAEEETGTMPSVDYIKHRQEVLISSMTVQYKAPWPVYLVLNETVIKQYNKLLQFCLSMKRAICLLQRLHFRELTNVHNDSHTSVPEVNVKQKESTSPLPWRLHRLQLLRQWLLYFSNVVHDHFATTALMPFQHNVENLLYNKPNLGKLLAEHDKLLNDVCKKCLLPEDNKQSPVQDTFAKVFGVVEEVARLWIGSQINVTPEHLTKLEENYASCHRYLVNLLVAITRCQYNPHLEALTLALVNSCPLNV